MCLVHAACYRDGVVQRSGADESRSFMEGGYKVRKVVILCFLGIGGLWVAFAIAAAVVFSLDDSPSGSSASAGVKASEADAEPVDESQLAATDAPDRKHVKVVAYAPAKANYSAFAHKANYFDSERIQGTKVYEYDLPENDGMHISLVEPGRQTGGYLSLEVYEDGVLVREKSEDEFGSLLV
jgi:hypothetical protein